LGTENAWLLKFDEPEIITVPSDSKYSLAHIPICEPAFELLRDWGVNLDPNYLVVKAAVGYEMSSIIITAGHPGYTWLGRRSFVLGTNITNRTLHGNFILYAASVCDKPENVRMEHNIYCRRYLGGGSNRVFDISDPDAVNEYRNTGDTQGNDLMFIAVDPGWVPSRFDMDIMGRVPEHIINKFDMTGVDDGDLQYPTANIYAHHLNWTNNGSEYLSQDYYDCFAGANTAIYRGAQFTSKSGDDRALFRPGKCHWSTIYDGVVQHRQGRGKGYIDYEAALECRRGSQRH
jgi:hypothetical protein